MSWHLAEWSGDWEAEQTRGDKTSTTPPVVQMIIKVLVCIQIKIDRFNSRSLRREALEKQRLEFRDKFHWALKTWAKLFQWTRVNFKDGNEVKKQKQKEKAVIDKIIITNKEMSHWSREDNFKYFEGKTFNLGEILTLVLMGLCAILCVDSMVVFNQMAFCF